MSDEKKTIDMLKCAAKNGYDAFNVLIDFGDIDYFRIKDIDT